MIEQLKNLEYFGSDGKIRIFRSHRKWVFASSDFKYSDTTIYEFKRRGWGYIPDHTPISTTALVEVDEVIDPFTNTRNTKPTDLSKLLFAIYHFQFGPQILLELHNINTLGQQRPVLLVSADVQFHTKKQPRATKIKVGGRFVYVTATIILKPHNWYTASWVQVGPVRGEFGRIYTRTTKDVFDIAAVRDDEVALAYLDRAEVKYATCKLHTVNTIGREGTVAIKNKFYTVKCMSSATSWMLFIEDHELDPDDLEWEEEG